MRVEILNAVQGLAEHGARGQRLGRRQAKVGEDVPLQAQDVRRRRAERLIGEVLLRVEERRGLSGVGGIVVEPDLLDRDIREPADAALDGDAHRGQHLLRERAMLGEVERAGPDGERRH